MAMENILLPPGTICVADTDWTGITNDSIEKLCFQRGDILIVLSYTSTECAVRNVEGTVGVVPSSSLVHRSPVTLSPMIWFHFCGSRAEAESLLDVAIEGQFLVRPSQTSESVYGLAVSTAGTVQHYLIANSIKTTLLTIDGQTFFPTLPELIKYYESDHAPFPSLLHPLKSTELLKYYIDKHSLKQFWGLSTDNIKVIKTVGKGEFGEVHAGTYRSYQVAIKSILESKDDGPAMQGFLQEAAILTHLRHKNLVQMVGVVFEGLSLKQIVLEFMSKGAVGKYLASRGRSVVAPSELLSIARDVCEGMVYISEQGFVHRDLAARNVLLNSNGQAKISDFGLARRAIARVPHEEGKFPIKWTSPEGLKDNIFSEQSDVWSFGICLWEVYSFGRVPYPSILAEDVLEQIEDGYSMDPPDNCPNGINSIMTQCWSYEPTNRPTFKEIQVMLSQSFGESRTPCSSPSPSRRTMIVTDRVEDQLLGPIASKIYLEAPSTQNTSLHLANIIMIGPKGAGKTSLVRCLHDNQFRQREQPTVLFDFPSQYCELTSHRAWLHSSQALVYDNELARVVIGSLLKESTQQKFEDIPPPLPPLIRPRPASIHLDIPPSLPLRPRPHRMSMLVESNSAGHYPMKVSGSHPDGFNVPSPTSPKTKHSAIKRRFSLTKLFRRTSSNSLLSSTHHNMTDNKSQLTPPSSPPLPIRSASISCFPEPEFISAIPVSLMEKLRNKLRDCMSGSLPPEVYGRLIDVPNHLGTEFFKHLLLTKCSIIVAVFDTSLEDPAKNLLDELTSLFSISTPPTNISIMLVGTHSNCHSSHAVAKQRLNQVRQAVRDSPFGDYLVNGNFIVSCESVFDQSAIEDVKKYIVDLVKRKYHIEVPLRWLRCVRRFQSLSSSGQYFISLSEAKSVIKEVCMVTSSEEVQAILQFLHDHLVIICNPQHDSIQSAVITNPQWLLESCSKLLGLAAPSIEASIPDELKLDHQLVTSQGILTDHLLEYICPSTPKAVKQDMLVFLNSLELIGLHQVVRSSLVSPCQSERNLVTSPFTSPPPTPSLTSPSSNIIGIVIPSVIHEPLPDNITPSSLESLYFVSSHEHCPLSLIFLRLLTRCLLTHHSFNSLYRDAGCFLINPHTVLLIQKKTDSISVSLHPSRNPPSSPSLSLSSSSSSATYMPSIETVLTVLMFIEPAISDICHTWCPGVQFKQAFRCLCNPSSIHYMLVDESISPRQLVKCQLGSFVSLPVKANPWFGEEISLACGLEQQLEDDDDEDELVNSDDIDLIIKSLQSSWLILGDAIGATSDELDQLKNAPHNKTEEIFKELCSIHLQSSPFLDLVANLEDIGHPDVADSLIDFRMKTSGIAL